VGKLMTVPNSTSQVFFQLQGIVAGVASVTDTGNGLTVLAYQKGAKYVEQWLYSNGHGFIALGSTDFNKGLYGTPALTANSYLVTT
jgi:hypothetical protein